MLRKLYGRVFSSEESGNGKNTKSASSAASPPVNGSTSATPERGGQKVSRTHATSGTATPSSLPLPSNEPLRVSSLNLQLHEENATTCACWVSADVVASGGRDKYISLLNVTTQRVESRFVAHESALTRCCYASASDRLITAARDGSIRFWNGSIELRTVKAAHSLAVTGLTASASQPHLATGARDCCVKLWDIRTAQLVRTVSIAQNVVTWLSWSTQRFSEAPQKAQARVPSNNELPATSGDDLIVQSSEDKLIRIWDSRTMQIAVQFPRAAHIQTHADLHIGAQQCVSSAHGDSNGRVPVTVWDMRTVRPFATLQGHRESVGWCSFLHDVPNGGTHVASVSNDGDVRIFRTDRVPDSGECVAQAQLATGFQTGACCSLLTRVDAHADAKQERNVHSAAGSESADSTQPTFSMYISTLQGGLFRLRYRAINDAITFF